MGRWSTDIWRLYARANKPDLLRWARALGRQRVDPMEVQARLQQLQVPREGTGAWNSEYQEVVNGLDYGDD